MTLLRRRLLAASLLVMSPAWGEESFYQIIDPNGGVMTIRGEKEVKPEKASKAPGSATAAPAGAAPANAAPANAAAAKAPAAAAAASPAAAGPASPSATAGYDSGDYTEAESLDAALLKQESTQKRFYMIDDQGPGVVNMQEGGTAVEAGTVELFSGNAEPEPDGFETLPDALVVYEAEAALAQWPPLAACQEARLLKRADEIGKLELTVILDRRAYSFPEAPGVLRVAEVSGEGPRSVRIQSYSAVNRAPAFALPPLALLGADGCPRRVVSGYAERAYDATERRFPMVTGEVLLHSEERFLVLLVKPDVPPVDVPYKTSPYGQMIFSLKK